MLYFVPDVRRRDVCGEDAAHFVSTRIVVGDKVIISDLNGAKFRVEIIEINKSKKLYKWKVIEELEVEEKPVKILFQAQIDNQYLAKMCEIAPHAGIGKIFIFQSDRSQKQSIRFDRLDKILTRSCEQSEVAFKPVIEFIDTKSLHELIKMHKPVLLDSSGADLNGDLNLQNCLVGPEGGWSEAELGYYKEIELEAVSLGGVVYPAWLAGFRALV